MGMWPDKGWMPWMMPPGVCWAVVVYKISYNIEYYWNTEFKNKIIGKII